MNKIKLIIFLLEILVLLSGAFALNFNFGDVLSDEDVWISIMPVQCNLNPWEKADYKAKSEKDSIKAYFEKNDVEIISMQIENKFNYVCAACYCPRGDIVHLLINAKDLNKIHFLDLVILMYFSSQLIFK
jgi:hypothetical protein